MKYIEEICMFLFICILIAILLIIQAGCVHKPIDTSMDINWEMDDQPPGVPERACLKQQDVERLTEVLIRCRAK